MSIGSNDFSKNALGTLQFRQDQSPVSQEFAIQKQKEAKQVNAIADIQSNDRSKAQEDSTASQLRTNIEETRAIDEKQLESTNDKMNQLNVQLSFEVSEKNGQSIVRVVDQESGDVVRQMPSEEFLKMSERIDDIVNQLKDMKGSLIKSEV